MTVLEGFMNIALGKPELSGFSIPLVDGACRDAARSILAKYDNPPEGGTLVPRAWVEEHLDELRAVAA